MSLPSHLPEAPCGLPHDNLYICCSTDPLHKVVSADRQAGNAAEDVQSPRLCQAGGGPQEGAAVTHPHKECHRAGQSAKNTPTQQASASLSISAGPVSIAQPTTATIIMKGPIVHQTETKFQKSWVELLDEVD